MTENGYKVSVNGYKIFKYQNHQNRFLEVPVVDGVEHGLGLMYEKQDEYISIVGTIPFVYGKQEGIQKVYAVDEQGHRYLSQIIPWIDNEVHGVRKWFYPNGMVEGVEPNQFGKREGFTMTYHENGRMRSVVPRKNDEIDGWVRCFNENGQPESECFYQNNQKLIEKNFKSDGSYIEKKYTSEGFYAEPVKCYNPDGSLNWVKIYYPESRWDVYSKIQYLNGKPIMREKFDTARNLVHKRVHTVGGWMTLNESADRMSVRAKLSGISESKNSTPAQRDAERREIVKKYHTKYPMFARQKTR